MPREVVSLHAGDHSLPCCQMSFAEEGSEAVDVRNAQSTLSMLISAAPILPEFLLMQGSAVTRSGPNSGRG